MGTLIGLVNRLQPFAVRFDDCYLVMEAGVLGQGAEGYISGEKAFCEQPRFSLQNGISIAKVKAVM